MFLKTEYRSEGSPYFYDEYRLADIVSMSGTLYERVKVKFNLMQNELLYLSNDGVDMLASTPVKKLKFHAFIENDKTHPEVILQSNTGAINAPSVMVYQVLEDSTAKLYKHFTVTYNDNKGYGEASVTRVFTKKETYYAVVPETAKDPVKIEKNKSAITSLFTNKKNAISDYVDRNKLNPKSESDLIAIFRYYNTLN